MTMTPQEALKEAIEFYETAAKSSFDVEDLDNAEFNQDIAEALRNLQNPWQPIETAPENVNVLKYYWSNFAKEHRYEADKVVYYGSGGARSHDAYATHWMPLPPHPTAGENDDPS